MNKLDEAMECFEKAIAHKPDFKSAHKNIVKLAMQQQDLAAVWRSANNAMLKMHSDTDVRYLYAKAANFVGKYDTAIEVFEELLAGEANNISFLHDLGIACRMNGDLDKALLCFKRVKQAKPENFSIYHNLGNTYSDMGNIDEAIANYEVALQYNPTYVETHKNLNHLLWESERNSEFLLSFQPLLNTGQISPPLLFSYIELLVFAKAWESALTTLEQYKYMLESEAEFYGFKASCEFALEHYDEAIDTLRFGVSLTKHQGLKRELGHQLVEANRLEEAEAQLVELLTQEPNDQLGIALLAYCREKSNPEWAENVNDYEGMIKEYNLLQRLEEKLGKDYLNDIKVFLLKQHSAQRAPLNQTLVEGTQTKGNLFKSQETLIQTLKEILLECVEDYKNTCASLPRNFHGERDVGEVEFAGAWSVKLSHNGHHNSHIHPEGWLSSVFYLDVVVGDEVKKESWLHFGSLPLQRSAKTEPVKYIKPEVGKLVLFPSYMWHGTLPNGLSDKRLTIAFDVRENDMVI
ncbi:tetratricopeptide repeat protein [Alteromonas sp. a30]|nr:tetratricopeptide repeat protein [Alteromonas sp. a30]